MEGKICNKCEVFKNWESYHKQSSRKDGHRSICKKCRKSYDSNYRNINKDKLLEQASIYREQNRDDLKEKNAEYRHKNKERERNRSFLVF